ncbi:heavy-metal-associated domain-containing protein [Pseudoalteromonas spongiae]|uniref:Heavy-metal-associated domain-containing protein n=1 Tax=Pseudoalteromonas spongiae TaxID=298657 RepID=A0ABU8EWJ2_9GAMM
MLKLTIDAMTCNHCANTIKDALKILDKCAFIDINLGCKTVIVASAKAKIDIIKTIEKVGYQINKINGIAYGGDA